MEGRMHVWVWWWWWWWWWWGGREWRAGWWESDICTPLHIAQVGSNVDCLCQLAPPYLHHAFFLFSFFALLPCRAEERYDSGEDHRERAAALERGPS